MGDALVPSATNSWVGKPERSPQRLRKAEREELRRAELQQALADTRKRSDDEAAARRAHTANALTSFALTSITNRTLQAKQEAAAAGLVDDVEYNMNIAAVLRTLPLLYQQIGSQVAGGGW